MLNQIIITELKHEGAQTRKLLERVPFDQWNWKPHEKSMTLGRLATHIAEIPVWTSWILTLPELDMAQRPYQKSEINSTEELLKVYDEKLQTAIADLNGTNDAALQEKWTFRRGEQILLSLPRMGMIRTLALSHWYHHRGQLSVYLRLLDVKIPGMYGPSADDSF